jgi:hypothetical protein
LATLPIFLIGSIYTALFAVAVNGPARRRHKRIDFKLEVRRYLEEGLVRCDSTECPDLLASHETYQGQDPLIVAALVKLLPKITPADQSLFQANDLNHLVFALTNASMPELRLGALHAIANLDATPCLAAAQAILREGPNLVNTLEVISLAETVVQKLESLLELSKKNDRLLRPAMEVREEVLLRPAGFIGTETSVLLRPSNN